MKQFGTILKFELKSYFTNKIFIGVTAALVAVIAAVMFFPQISGIFDKSRHNAGNNSAQSQESDAGDLPLMLIASGNSREAELIQQSFSAAFTDYDVQTTDAGLDSIREQITSGEAGCAFVMDGLTSYTYYVKDLSIQDSNTAAADEILQNIYRLDALTRGGFSAEEAQAILSAQVSHITLNLGKDQVQNFLYTYIMIFALYMVILLYGQMVATNVAAEKSSRAMELLITSAKPVSMMFGKVIASCLAGLIQLAAVFGAAVLCYNINKSHWADNAIIASIFDMPGELIAYLLVFFVLGFFIYAFLFGAIGSTVSKVEDINTAVTPITILFVFAFLVVMLSLSNGTVDNLLMRVCSYIPFTSPMAMFTRIAMSTVPFYEAVISIAVLIVSVIGIGVLSAKIYRVGVLLYGTKPKISSIGKALTKA